MARPRAYSSARIARSSHRRGTDGTALVVGMASG
ncbi:hypothetical protein SKA58_03750 [Sphingomonas sp. SKA58]|nr:hypothetical protein SKA58_03750 [Sphingomonas sp. SKA58]